MVVNSNQKGTLLTWLMKVSPACSRGAHSHSCYSEDHMSSSVLSRVTECSRTAPALHSVLEGCVSHVSPAPGGPCGTSAGQGSGVSSSSGLTTHLLRGGSPARGEQRACFHVSLAARPPPRRPPVPQSPFLLQQFYFKF